MKQTIFCCVLGVLSAFAFSIFPNSVYAQSSEEITMAVGETKTLYLPYSVTSKTLKSVTFYSNGISYVQVLSYNNYSVNVKAVKAFSSPIIVRCDYRYFVRNGSYVYEATGYYDFKVNVGGSDGESSGIKPTSISFPTSIKAIKVGESHQLTPTVLPSNATYKLTWSISDKNVATISQDGMLVGKSTGEADLKVMADNGVYAMLRIVVSKAETKTVVISPLSVDLQVGESSYLSAKVYPSSADQSVTWSSSDASIVSVSSSGRLVGLKPGYVIITARANTGETGLCGVECRVAVPDITISDKDGLSIVPPIANVIYRRQFYSGWNSVCVPFGISKSMLEKFSPQMRIATIVEFEVIGKEKFISLKEVNSADAGKPCMIYSPDNILCEFNLEKVGLRTYPDNSSKMKGAYQRSVVGANCYKLTDDGKAFSSTRGEDAIVAPFRGYIKFDGNSQAKSTVSNETVKIEFKQINY